jgi:hypothetical protein
MKPDLALAGLAAGTAQRSALPLLAAMRVGLEDRRGGRPDRRGRTGRRQHGGTDAVL